MHKLLSQLNIKQDQKEWYKITSSIMCEHGGSALLAKYNNSISKLLCIVFPEYQTHCQDLVMTVVQDLKLPKVEDFLTVSLQYPHSAYSDYLLGDIKFRDHYHLLKQHGYSVSKRT